ncbi:metallohydrolase [Roseomonas mucosa]|uniref:metallohydrolase n=1 Tax=Roseomonas mucosa TaxID=207340 RepID=UPI0028CBD0A6|nr:metallohydrolase [Roseomonas mucosa]MDT8292221.1 metallohydrolase [Roseomonas mucosa]
MSAIITVFPVCNGDMTLVEFESGRTLLIDINIRQPSEDIRDVAQDLRDRLKKDSEGRPYVDAMLLTHPDQDHCRGFVEHFHVGPLTDYSTPKKGEEGKIVIREMWSSPMTFRRKKKKDKALCADAEEWRQEARRRVNLFKAGKTPGDGDRIQVLGEDESGKTDNLDDILVKTGGTIERINGEMDKTFSGYLIAPKEKGTDEEEETRSKNNSSVIMRLSIANGEEKTACRYLLGGDAEVGIWERVWADHKRTPGLLEYNLMQAPHHCSWHSLSWESWGDTNGEAEVSQDARKALGQALADAYIVASSKEISDDDCDPPCYGAKEEYEDILSDKGGTFLNTEAHKHKGEVVPMVFEVTEDGPVLQATDSKLGIKDTTTKRAAVSAAYLQTRAAEVAQRAPVQKEGGGRYA